MADNKRNWKAATGVDEFYYAVLDEDKNEADGDVFRVKFLQEITVEFDDETEKAYGDNKTAEIAYSQGDVTVTSQFHTIPLEDKKNLLGMDEDDDIYSFGSNNVPPYVSIVFAKTFEDGSREYVGLPKGMFTRPDTEGETKEDGVDFSSEEMEGEFMDRKIEGEDDEKVVLMTVDKKGDFDKGEKLFEKIFGEDYDMDDDSDAPKGDEDEGDESGES